MAEFGAEFNAEFGAAVPGPGQRSLGKLGFVALGCVDVGLDDPAARESSMGLAGLVGRSARRLDSSQSPTAAAPTTSAITATAEAGNFFKALKLHLPSVYGPPNIFTIDYILGPPLAHTQSYMKHCRRSLRDRNVASETLLANRSRQPASLSFRCSERSQTADYGFCHHTAMRGNCAAAVWGGSVSNSCVPTAKSIWPSWLKSATSKAG